MTTKEILLKYTFIIERVKRGDYPSFTTIREYLKHRFEALDVVLDYSDRTFLRDKKEIEELYGIEITYSKSQRGYEVVFSEEGTTEKSLEAFNLFITLREASKNGMASYILPDYKCLIGAEHIQVLLGAIRNRQLVTFAYSKFTESYSSIRTIAPYYLKESQGRWYVLGKDQGDGEFKVFGLDRMAALVVEQRQYNVDQRFSAEAFFEHRYGVNAYCESGAPEEIKLQFDKAEGVYLKTKQLHPSQQIAYENDSSVEVAIKVYPSQDFIMMLLSYGSKVQVISPLWLAKKVEDEHIKAAKSYKKRS